MSYLILRIALNGKMISEFNEHTILFFFQAQKNRVVLMKLEEEFVNYVSNPSRTEPLRLPSWDSYHRMLAHRLVMEFV